MEWLVSYIPFLTEVWQVLIHVAGAVGARLRLPEEAAVWWTAEHLEETASEWHEDKNRRAIAEQDSSSAQIEALKDAGWIWYDFA